MISTNLDAMAAHTAWMNANANNVANVNTENYDASRTVLDAGPTAVGKPTGQATNLSREIPEQIVISGGFSAQVTTIETQDAMLGTLLDMKG